MSYIYQAQVVLELQCMQLTTSLTYDQASNISNSWLSNEMTFQIPLWVEQLFVYTVLKHLPFHPHPVAVLFCCFCSQCSGSQWPGELHPGNPFPNWKPILR